MFSVVVTTLSGDVTTYNIPRGSSVGDVPPQRAGDSSNSSYFHRGRAVRRDTPLADLVDGSGVVKLVLVSYTGSRTKKKKRRRAERENDPGTSTTTTPYSLADPGLDDAWEGTGRVGETVHRGGVGVGALTRRNDSRQTSPTDDLVGRLRSKYRDRIHYDAKIERRNGRVIDFERAGIPGFLADCLKEAGIPSLYGHQVEAWNARAGNFVVTTSTASGKTVCYLLPLMHLLNEDKNATALLLFPTKALAQDQLVKVQALGSRLGIGVDIIDGDTPLDVREDIIRRKSRLLVSNPDFISMGLADHGRRYRWLFAELSALVIDEAHVYTGVFGCHVALLLRRIKRLTLLYAARSKLRFYMCSATLSNAAEFASTLCGEDVVVVDRDDSPSAGKRMVIWRPPLVANSVTRRKSAIYEAAVVMSELVRGGLTTIVFAKTRKLAELVFGYTLEILNANDETKHLSASLAVYRAGFSPNERRSIERRLFDGKIMGVCATNALELGIDFEVDAVVTLGWPGSRASLWQQAGRAGRRGLASWAFYVPFDGVLDNYFVRNPLQLFDVASIEPTIVSIKNTKIVASHLRAAAYEEPLDPDKDLDMFGSAARAVVESLLREGELRQILDGKRLAYSGNQMLPEKFQLRSIDDRVVTIVERGSSKVLEAIEAFKAPFFLYPGAIWMKQGAHHLVEGVDWSAGIARVVKASQLNYYTTVVDCLSVKTKTWLPSDQRAFVTPAEVSIRFPAFCRRRRRSGVAIDTITIHGVPEVRFDTTAMIVPLHSEWCPEAVHAAAHALLGVLPRFFGVGDEDVGAECNVEHCPHITDRLLLFDRHGSFGLCDSITREFGEVVKAAADALKSCGCQDGCPLCCHLASCGTYNAHLSKRQGLELLQAIM